MDNSLMTDFKPVSFDEWLAKIEKDLKGKTLENLEKPNFEGIVVHPVYNREKTNLTTGTPGKAPYSRGAKPENNEWTINQDFQVKEDNAKTINTLLLKQLMDGVNGVTLSGNVEGNLATLFNEIGLPHIETFIRPEAASKALIEEFITTCEKADFDVKTVKGAIECDPFGLALSTGYFDEGEMEATLESALHSAKFAPAMRSVLINGYQLHMAGATTVQELGIALAEGHEYLVALMEKGLSVDAAAARLQFEFSTGTQYFFEIAKLKAFRMLWSRIIEEYLPEHDCSHTTYVHARTSEWFHTVYDAHNNMLRDTSAAMAAAIAGADAITVTPFDSAYQDETSFSNRMAKNIQLILKDESGLGKIIDASAGSYYIEDLIDQYLEKGWDIFTSIEKSGGYKKAILAGDIQKMVTESATKKAEWVKESKMVMIGVNKYPNQEETAKDKVKKTLGASAPSKQNIEPLVATRAASELELNRINQEK
tara:strand:- start:1616 stop:3058 length:1443 start_codon:yes stop_codon:yes gene_type:complete